MYYVFKCLQQGLKDAAYAITVISTLIGVPFFVAFMEWTRDLVNLIEQVPFPGLACGFIALLMHQFASQYRN